MEKAEISIQILLDDEETVGFGELTRLIDGYFDLPHETYSYMPLCDF